MDLEKSPLLPPAQQTRGQSPPIGTADRKYRVLRWTVYLLLAGFALWTMQGSSLTLKLNVGQNDQQPGSSLSQKPISIMSDITSETEEWEENSKFCNVVGSGGDIAYGPDGTKYDSWIHAWGNMTDYKGSGNPPCAAQLAEGEKHSDSMIGGHVVEYGEQVSPGFGVDNIVRVVPLCETHNRYTSAPALEATSGVTAVLLKNYCIWGDGQSSCKNVRTDSACGKGVSPMTRTTQSMPLITNAL